MSIPVGAMPLAAAQAVGTPFELAVQSINTNPIFIGLMMLSMNLGGRFLPFEITKGQEAILQHPYFRRFMIFVIIFIATRNIVTAFWLAIIIILCMGYFFNEHSSLCIWKGGLDGSTCSMKEGFEGDAISELTPEEKDILYKLREKENKINALKSPAVKTNIPIMKSPLEKYNDNINNIKNA
jgi:hypothetical protein